MTHKRKLIEVALPLDAINAASVREKSIRHGHPSTVHLWWARRPLAAARAVLFAQLVDDPSAHPDLFPTDAAQQRERERLFGLIRELVQWETTTNEDVLSRARDEIWKSWRRACFDHRDHPQAKQLFDPDRLPAFHDPFAGGGSLPLEAQRLGLEAYASDLNPVAVLITKAMIEIPPRFAGRAPVNPESSRKKALFTGAWTRARGLAEDVRYYGKWMRDEAARRIGHLYPAVEVTAELARQRPDLKRYVGRRLTVIAWLWARTVKSPNPAFGQVQVPLASTFLLSTKPGNEAYVEPVIEPGGYRFTVKRGKPNNPEVAKKGTKAGGSGSSFLCLMSGAAIPFKYLRDEAKAGRMGARLMAIVAEGDRERVYLPPMPEQEAAAQQADPWWKPETDLAARALGFRVQEYAMRRWADLFTPRQLVALTTFSDLVGEAMARVQRDAVAAGLPDDGVPLRDGGSGAQAYAEAVAVYLAFGVDRLADRSSTICVWDAGHATIHHTFARPALPMTWDYAEGNPFSDSTGNVTALLAGVAEFLDEAPATVKGSAAQHDAPLQVVSANKVVSTDPPYYDNIGYADLSDFFYVWLRRSLKGVYPDLFATLVVPKAEELVATPYRHGSKEQAEAFFLDGMTRAMQRLAEQAHPAFPVTIYYAFKQTEDLKQASDSGGADEPSAPTGVASTGWETFLGAVIRAGFAISGTWPIRSERSSRLQAQGANALASSIVLVCRRRPVNAPTATRREFLAALKAELPGALKRLQHGNVAPVDLAQAAIGPGMAVYTRYSKVLDAAGTPLTVREALALINQVLDEVLAEQEGDLDADTRWAVAWFEQHGFAEGDFGVAETLSKAKNTSVSGLVEAGILDAKRGRVRLLRPEELPPDWDPNADRRPTVWEMVHQLVRALETGGEATAAALVAKLGSRAEVARELAYRLYSVCERKRRAEEARSYNALVQSWPEIARLAQDRAPSRVEQTRLFAEGSV